MVSGPLSSERRRSPRYVVHGVRGFLTFQAEARILDLGLAGVSVETTYHLEVGKAYSIKLAHDGRELRLSGVVLRSRFGPPRPAAGGTAPLYRVGVRFKDLDPDQVAALRGLLGASAEIALDGELSGHFELGQPESLRLGRDYQFEVHKMSATGMLIEARLSPRIDSLIEVCVPLDGHELRATARVAYSERIVGAADRHHLGVEFRDMNLVARSRLEAFIADQVT